MRTLVFLIGFLFFACQESVSVAPSADRPSIFFDLKKFFQQEKLNLTNMKSFKKTVSMDGKVEEKKLEHLNLDNEFSVFIDADINRLAWSDKYRADSVFTAQKQLSKITYTALDESLRTKKIGIDFKNDAVATISIEKGTDNAVAQSKQHLTYLVGKGYTIKNEQTLSLSDTKTVTVQVEYY